MIELRDLDFPEIESELGRITFDYLELEEQLIISFKPKDLSNSGHFYEGSIFINVSSNNFECDKVTILKIIQDAVDSENKNGAELQQLIVTQLHKISTSIEVDEVLQPQEH